METIKKVYDKLIYLSIILLLLKTIIPISDLFWFVFIVLAFLSTIILFEYYRKIDYLKIKSLINKSKLILISIVLYIIIDAFNIISASNYILFISRYTIFVQGVCVFLCILLLYSLNYKDYSQIISNIYKWISIAGIVVGIIVLLNYLYPIMETENPLQISVFGDYNTFCRFFLFAFLVSNIYIYNTNTSIANKMIFIFLYSILVFSIVLLSSSRRSLFSIIIVLLANFVYLTIKSYKQYRTKKFNVFSIMVIFIFITMCSGIIANGFVSQSIKYNSNHYDMKVERIAELKGRDSFAEIIVGIFSNSSKHKDKENILVADNETTEKETITIIERLENDQRGLFYARKIIWNEAIGELCQYDIKDIIIGKGSGYSSELYKIEPHATAMRELNHYKKNEEINMHPHNYLLQDFLEGGLIKVIASILATLGLGIYVILKMVRNSNWFIPFMSLILIATNIMISYNKGFLGDTYYVFNLYIILLLNSNTVTNKEQNESFDGKNER